MPHLLGQANPDCDWKDKNSKFGCRAQSTHRIGIREQTKHQGIVRAMRDVPLDPKMVGEWLFTCRHHASNMSQGIAKMVQEMQRAARRAEELADMPGMTFYTLVIQDLALVKEAEEAERKKKATARLLIPGKDF